MDNDEAAADDPDPSEMAAQERVADQLLLWGLAGLGLRFAVAHVPAWPLFTLETQAFTVTFPLLLYALAGGAGVVFVLLQAHYVMRFMWARGQFVHLESTFWEDHSHYFFATALVMIAAGLSSMFV